LSTIYIFILYLDISRNGLARRVELSINPGTHKACTSSSAPNQVDPDGRPSKVFLKGTDGKKSNRGSEGSATVDKTSYSTKRLFASTHRRMGRQVSSDSRCDDVIGSEEFVNVKLMDRALN
jgi:hypothetical protein